MNMDQALFRHLWVFCIHVIIFRNVNNITTN